MSSKLDQIWSIPVFCQLDSARLSLSIGFQLFKNCNNAKITYNKRNKNKKNGVLDDRLKYTGLA